MNLPVLKSKRLGTGKPLVLLHAFPLSNAVWNDLQPPKGYEFILPDFPGFGDSPLAESGFTLEQAALSLQNHLEESGINARFALGGISMGGYWAMEHLRQFPGKVDRLVLLSTRPGVDKPEGRQNRLNMAERVEKEGVQYLPEILLKGLLGASSLAEKPAVVERVRRLILQADPHAVALAQRAMAQRRDQTAFLATLKLPALVLAGLEDQLIPSSEAETMAKAISGSRLGLLGKVGHLLPLEDPASCQKMFNDFFSATA